MAQRILKEREKYHRNDKYYVAFLKEFFPHHALSEITSLNVVQMRAKLKARPVGPITVNRYHQTLKTILNKAREWGYLSGENPASLVKIEREKKFQRKRFLDKEEGLNERERLLEVCQRPEFERAYPIVMCALETGMRPGEIENVRKKHINLDRCDIFIPESKNGDEGYAYFFDRLFRVLEPIVMALEDPEDKVFDFRNFTKIWKRIRREAKLEDIVFYTLRHTYASHLTMETGDLHATGGLLRQRTPGMAARYSHLAPGYLRSAASKLEERWSRSGHKSESEPITQPPQHSPKKHEAA